MEGLRKCFASWLKHKLSIFRKDHPPPPPQLPVEEDDEIEIIGEINNNDEKPNPRLKQSSHDPGNESKVSEFDQPAVEPLLEEADLRESSIEVLEIPKESTPNPEIVQQDSGFVSQDVGDDEFNDYVPAAESTRIEEEPSESYVFVDDSDFIEVLDERNIFTERRPTNNPHFISEDPEENADINDPQWDIVRNLQTDFERMQYAMEAFGNLEPGDPTKNLSFHGFFRQRLRILKNLPDDEVFEDEENLPWSEGIKIRNGRIVPMEDYEEDLREFTRKRKALAEHEDAPGAKRRLIDIPAFKRSMENIAIKYKKDEMPRKDLKFYMRHCRRGIEETTSFLQYYRDEEDHVPETLVNETEVKKTESIEQTYGEFRKWYGASEVEEECKDCSYQERVKIRHSL